MAALVYDVAISVDGFIAQADGSVGTFLQTGPHVEAYLDRLSAYAAVIMGRKTYEFGYAWGLKPGDKPYPHLRTSVVSSTLDLPPESDIGIIRSDLINSIAALKESCDGDIYLCGGGALAGELVQARLLDRLILKVNPIVLGQGIGLFGGHSVGAALHLTDRQTYENGVCVLSYEFATEAEEA